MVMEFAASAVAANWPLTRKRLIQRHENRLNHRNQEPPERAAPGDAAPKAAKCASLLQALLTQ